MNRRRALTMMLAGTAGAKASAEEVKAVMETSGGAAAPMPRVYAPVRSRSVHGAYPWHERIVTTIFWIGESPTANNPTPNNKSSWDPKWESNFGGYDDPDPANRTWDFCPKGFQPGQNPFYIALPYNDVLNSWTTKPEARRVIPWFKQKFVRSGQSVCKGQWLAIRYGKKVCYAQWEDCGPFNTEDYGYVFGSRRPKNRMNGGAGLDVSPAVRDYMGIRSGAACDWRFVSVGEVPDGPWRRYGTNNDFVLAKQRDAAGQLERMEELRRQRERWLEQQRAGS